jgi:signal peptidase II
VPPSPPPARPLSRLARALVLGFVVVSLFGCDHATKMAAKASLENAAAVSLAPDALLELRYVENRDIAFSALGALGLPHSPELLVGLASAAIGIALAAFALAAFQRRRDSGPPAALGPQVGFALIVGGGLGNIVDRLARGYVVDFIHVRGWPVFNVADIAVVVGMGLLALDWTRRRPQRGGGAAEG